MGTPRWAQPERGTLLSVEASRKRAAELLDEILETVEPLGEKAHILVAVARLLMKRVY